MNNAGPLSHVKVLDLGRILAGGTLFPVPG